MPKARCAFRESEVRRAIRGVESSGRKVGAVEFRPDGSFLVRTEGMDSESTAGKGDDLAARIERLSKNGEVHNAR